MSAVSDLVRRMGAAGASAEMIAIAIEAIEETIEARRAGDRDRKRRQRAGSHGNSCDVTGLDVTDRDGSPPSPSLEGSLRNPPITLTLSTPPIKAKRPARSKFCPDDWSPDPDVTVELIALGYTAGHIERELARLRRHEFKDPRTNWDKTYFNWISKDPPQKEHHNGSESNSARNARERQENISRAFAAADTVAEMRRRGGGQIFDSV